MVNQQFFIPMVPNSAPIVINVNQYDFDAAGYAGRFIFNLVNEGVPYNMDGATAVFEGQKPDGKVFAYAANVVSASVVRVNLKTQMTNVAGRVVCTLVLSNTDGVVGSYNIWLEVQGSSIAGADASQTDIPALVAEAKEDADRAEQAAINAEAWSEHPPYIGANGDWFVYDPAQDLYIDSGVYSVGRSGNKWYEGTAVSGKSLTPTAYATGIDYAYINDFYLNTTEGAVYHNTVDGDESTALWVYDFTLTGAANSLASLNDVGLTTPQEGQLLTYDAVNHVWENKDPDKSFVRFAGSIIYANLMAGTGATGGTYLSSEYEDMFFLITDGTPSGGISSTDIGKWASSYSVGDEIPPDAHIAVINVGTELSPDYRFDDFGGYIDISGKADRNEIIQWVTASALSGATTKTISNAIFKTTSYITDILATPYNNKPIKYSTISVANGSITITFPALPQNTDFAIGVYNPV